MIASGKKTVETRTWATRYRGPVLIVSSLSPRVEPAGYALAVAEIVESRPMMPADEGAAGCKVYPKAYAWVLRNVRAIKPFRVQGRLGLYDVRVTLRTVGRCALADRTPEEG